MAVLLSPNCLAISGCATEMLLRSMYVIRYMKLMRSRTSQRVPVGLDAAFSSVAALAEADVRFMSGILAPVVALNNWNEEGAGFCSARLQAGTLSNLQCPPEGGRYIDQIRAHARVIPGFARALSFVLRRNRFPRNGGGPKQARRCQWADFPRPIGPPPDKPASPSARARESRAAACRGPRNPESGWSRPPWAPHRHAPLFRRASWRAGIQSRASSC